MAITILGKDVTNISIDEKEVIRISDYLTGDIIFEKVPVNYFYIQNTYSETNTITITSTADGNPSEDCFTRVIEYSKDRRIWTTVVLEHQVSTTITLNQNEKVYFRNTNGKLNYYNTVEYFYTSFSASQSHIVGGNVETLVDYRNIGRINYQYSGTYSNLFRDDTTLTSASGLIMPSNNLSASCMSDMFRGCTSLTDAPDLPATTLSKYCYQRMFAECRSLTDAPDLPATSVQDGVYRSMFRNCTNLTDAHELNLKVLTKNCYNNMFAGCTSLIDAPAIYALVYGESSCEWMFDGCTSLSSMQVYADDASATNCTRDWLRNVAPTGTFNNYGSVVWDYPSTSGIPQGWMEVIPEDYFCIKNTYNGINTLSVKVGRSTTDPYHHTRKLEYSFDKTNWNTIDLMSSNLTEIEISKNGKVYFRNNIGKFSYKYSESLYFTISFDCSNNYNVSGKISTLLNYNSDEVYCNENFTFSNLFANSTTLTDASGLKLNVGLYFHCFESMFNGCTRLSSAPNLQETVLAEGCYYKMFSGCSSLTTAPALPATTLSRRCYSNMFVSCTSLTTAPVLPATALVDSCYSYMFAGCTSLNDVTSYANSKGNYSLDYWLSEVSATGTFHKLGKASYPRSASGIPSGWTIVNS